MMADMADIDAQAPGKLYIAGEYAVTNTSSPAVLVAVDRFVHVHLHPHTSHTNVNVSTDAAADPAGHAPTYATISADRYPFSLSWRRDSRGDPQPLTDPGYYRFALMALTWADRFAREIATGDTIDDSHSSVSSASSDSTDFSHHPIPSRPRTLPLFDLSISSELTAEDGTKYGLGSSAAVCVAVVRAVCAFWRQQANKHEEISDRFAQHDGSDVDDWLSRTFGDSRTIIFKLAAIAHVSVQGNGSLGDVAACSYGGWLLYHSFDRSWLKRQLDALQSGALTLSQLIAQQWPCLGLKRINADPHIRLLVGWTGTPASTEKLVAQADKPVDPENYRRFVTASAECATSIAFGLEKDEWNLLSGSVARNRALLENLSHMRNVPIETTRLASGIEAALSNGFAAKTSGAGRGDCFIALGDQQHGKIEDLFDQWRESGSVPLDLHPVSPADSEFSVQAISGSTVTKDDHTGDRTKDDRINNDALDPGTDASAQSSSAHPRKEEHIQLADRQNSARLRKEQREQRARRQQELQAELQEASSNYLGERDLSGFARVHLVRPTLPESRVADSDISATICGEKVHAPFFIEAMTGGTAHTTRFNCELARCANKHGIALAFGSASLTAKDPAALSGFAQARELTNYPVFANVNPNTPLDAISRIVDVLHPTALQVHVNAVQELVMPEGDRDFMWLEKLIRIKNSVAIPVVVKEIGFGWDVASVRGLLDDGFEWLDIGGMGGTNFALIENARRSHSDGDYSWLADCGVSTVQSILNVRTAIDDASHKSGIRPTMHYFASGGVRTPLDVMKSLALGADGVGVAGRFLTTLLHEGEQGLDHLIGVWKEQLACLYALYGVSSTSEARHIPYTLVQN